MEPLQQQQPTKISPDAAVATAAAADMVCPTDDYPELHIVFDFFADNPQKVMPNDGTGPQRDNPFFDPYWESIRLMQESELFLEGSLLKSVDCKRNSNLIYLIMSGFI